MPPSYLAALNGARAAHFADGQCYHSNSSNYSPDHALSTKQSRTDETILIRVTTDATDRVGELEQADHIGASQGGCLWGLLKDFTDRSARRAH